MKPFLKNSLCSLPSYKTRTHFFNRNPINMFVANRSVVVGKIGKDDMDAFRGRDVQVRHSASVILLLLLLLVAIAKNNRASMGIVILSVTMAVLLGLLEEASMKKSGAKIVSRATGKALVTYLYKRVASVTTTTLPDGITFPQEPRNATPTVFLAPFVAISFINDCPDNATGDFAIEICAVRGFVAYALGMPLLLLIAFYFVNFFAGNYGRATNIVFVFIAAACNAIVSGIIVEEIIRRTRTETDLKELDEALMKEVDARRGVLVNRATKKADRRRRRR